MPETQDRPTAAPQPSKPKTHDTTFVVVSDYRSGSSLLIQSLNQHPELCTVGEVFSRSWEPMCALRDPFGLREIKSPDVDRDALSSYLDHIIETYNGFKVIRRELPTEHPAWTDLASRTELKVLDLRRLNLLDQRLSGAIQKLNKRANFRQGLELPPQRTVELDPQFLLRQFEMLTEQWARFEEIFHGHLRLKITYEDLREQYDQTMLSVQEFLGVTPQSLPQVTQKIVKGSLRERITNYDELKLFFRHTPYASFFRD